jgi:hypothetical protein
LPSPVFGKRLLYTVFLLFSAFSRILAETAFRPTQFSGVFLAVYFPVYAGFYENDGKFPNVERFIDENAR